MKFTQNALSLSGEAKNRYSLNDSWETDRRGGGHFLIIQHIFPRRVCAMHFWSCCSRRNPIFPTPPFARNHTLSLPSLHPLPPLSHPLPPLTTPSPSPLHTLSLPSLHPLPPLSHHLPPLALRVAKWPFMGTNLNFWPQYF